MTVDSGERPGAAVVAADAPAVLFVAREQYHDTVARLKAEGFEMCVDLTAVDYLERPARRLPAGVDPARFEVVAVLVAFDPARRVRLRVQVPESDPTVPTLWDVYPGVEAYEREVFDLFGIRFEGHPDLTRILMPEDWEGHPLRKDYPVGRVPVQFKAAPPTR